MFRRFIAASFVAIWFLLFGIEFCQECGFFDYDEPETDRAVEATLASLGQAIKGSDSLQLTTSRTLSAQPEVVSTSYDVSPYVESVASFVSKETESSKAHFKIHKLHQVFLI